MMTVILPFLLLLLFLAFGMHIAFAMGIAGAIGLIINGGLAPFLGILQTTPYETTKSYMLTTVPMFILMAHFMSTSNITRDLFYSAYK